MLLIVLLLLSVSATHLIVQYGSKTVHYLYSTESTSIQWAGGWNGEYYVVGVIDGYTYNLACRQVISTQILLGPQGCSDTDHFLCSDVDGTNKNRLLNNWDVPPNECDSPGDCFGPFGEYIVSGAGPMCMIPLVTWVHLTPETVVVEGCFNGSFYLDYTDGGLPNSTGRVYTNGGSLRLLWDRYDDLDKTIKLVQMIGNPYTVLHESQVEHNMFPSYINFSVGCEVNLHWTNKTRVLIDPIVPNDVTYKSAPEVPFYYTSSMCNFFVGGLGPSGELTVPGVPENVLVGGIPRLCTPGEVCIPYKITPTSMYKDFEGDCKRFYPRSPTFTTQNGATFSRSVPSIFTCFAPFPHPELIDQKGGSLEEKHGQCRRKGGRLSTGDVCAMTSSITHCKKDHLYWDEHCYLIFNAEIDQKYKGTQAQAETTCQSLDAKSTSVVPLDIYTKRWLLDDYIWFGGTGFRVPVKGRRCLCMYIENSQSISRNCDCDEPQFPLCRYHRKDHPIEFSKFHMDTKTATILRDGQDGIQHNGRAVKCDCFVGSTGPQCTRRTCVTPTEAALSLEDSLNSVLLAFFKACYSNHGTCLDMLPDRCACDPGYAPPASLRDRDDTYKKYPCTCPAVLHPVLSLGYTFTNTTYHENTWGICNHAFAGSCQLDLLGKGKCVATLLPNLNPASRVRFKPEWDGKALSCKRPIILPTGTGFDIQEKFCNAHGTCCPHGERLDEQVLSTTNTELWGRIECEDRDGCACDNGYGGESCTSIVPAYIYKSRLIFLDGVGWFYKLPHRTTITYVLGIGDNYEMREDLNAACPGCKTGWYVVGQQSGTALVYDTDFPICGYHVNLYMARFFDNAAFRSFGAYYHTQKFEFARNGSTTTNCQCDSNHSGPRCGDAISAIRFEEDEWVRYSCGENTIPKRGVPTEDFCACNKEFSFHGSACQCRAQCHGKGLCIEPNFGYGRCSGDLDAVVADAVIVPPVTQQFIQYIVTDDSYAFVDGFFWHFPIGTVVEFLGVFTDSIQTNHSILPVVMRWTCSAVSSVVANISIQINPMTEPYSILCDTYMMCGFPTCNGILTEDCTLGFNGFQEMDSDQILETGIYNQTILSHFSASRLSEIRPDVKYGVFRCNDAVDHLIDSSLKWLELIVTTQCVDDEHQASKGKWNGLFDSAIPGLSFEDEWTDEHYKFLDSILEENWNESSTDLFITSQVLRFQQDELITYNVSGVNYNLNLSGDALAEGYSGNPYRNGVPIPEVRRWNGVPGVTLNIPTNDTEARLIEFICPVHMSEIQLTGPDGVACNTHLESCEPGDTVSLQCVGEVESLGVILHRLLNYTHLIPFYYNHTYLDYTLWYQGEYSEDFSFTLHSRAGNYHDLWNELRKEIYVDHSFGNVSHGLSRDLLESLYKTYLSPRRCTESAQCKAFGVGECRFEDRYHIPWRNGDPSLPVVAIGEEGGCDCRISPGVFDHTSSCELCLTGYGPPQDTDEYEACSVPWALGKACQGFGTPVHNITTRTVNETTYLSHGHLVRKVHSHVNDWPAIETGTVDIHRWGDLVVVQGRFFKDGIELVCKECSMTRWEMVTGEVFIPAYSLRRLRVTGYILDYRDLFTQYMKI